MYCTGLNKKLRSRSQTAKYCITATMCKGFPGLNFGPAESDYCIDGLGYGYFRLPLKSVSTHLGEPLREFWFDFCSSMGSSCGHSICWFLCLLMSPWCVSDSLRLFVTDNKTITQVREAIRGFSSDVLAWGGAHFWFIMGADWSAAGHIYKTANDQSPMIAF